MAGLLAQEPKREEPRLGLGAQGAGSWGGAARARARGRAAGEVGSGRPARRRGHCAEGLVPSPPPHGVWPTARNSVQPPTQEWWGW